MTDVPLAEYQRVLRESQVATGEAAQLREENARLRAALSEAANALGVFDGGHEDATELRAIIAWLSGEAKKAREAAERMIVR